MRIPISKLIKMRNKERPKNKQIIDNDDENENKNNSHNILSNIYKWIRRLNLYPKRNQTRKSQLFEFIY